MAVKHAQSDVTPGMLSVPRESLPLPQRHTGASPWNAHELALICLGFVMPLGLDAKPTFLAGPMPKMGAAAMSIFFLTISAIRMQKDARLGAAARLAITPVVLYASILAAVTFTQTLPLVRYQLFVPVPIAIFGYIICERHRPGSFFEVTFRVSCLHLLLAAVANQTHLISTGASRLGGATDGVLVGFESAVVILACLARLRRGTGRRALTAATMTLAAYTLFAAFSRAALISTTVALLLSYALARRHKVLAVTYIALASYIVYQYSGYLIKAFLGGNDPQSLNTASGRYTIWQRLWDHDDHRLFGYGVAAIHDGFGPDAALWRINQGLPAENAALQAFLMAGILGITVWLWFAVRAFHVMWSIRHFAGGISLSFGVVLAVDIMFSGGQSMSSYPWWWLLSMFSLANAVGIGELKARSTNSETAHVRLGQ